MLRGVNKDTDFGRIEGAAGQRRRAALLLAPPSFRKLLTPLMLLLQLHLGSSYSKAVAACKSGGRFEVTRGWTIVADINGNKKLWTDETDRRKLWAYESDIKSKPYSFKRPDFIYR